MGALAHGDERGTKTIAADDISRAETLDASDPDDTTTPSEDERSDGARTDGDEHGDGAFCPYAFIKRLPPHAAVCGERGNRPAALPRRTRRSCAKTLVLDLDETLVHCSLEPIDDADLRIDVPFGGQSLRVHVRKRPGLDAFLDAVSGRFEVVVFTASQRAYADRLLDRLDPQRQRVKHRLFREACVEVHGNLLKDLSVLGRDLSQTILVDNSPHAFGYQLDNGVPIRSWFDDRNDSELAKLLPFLDSILEAEDVRPAIRARFALHQRVEDAQD
jgi:CTD small phosphatase-like protein 2